MRSSSGRLGAVIDDARPLAVRFTPATWQWHTALVMSGSLLIALCAQVAVPLPQSPVPVTGQTFAVLLVGATLGSRLGASAVLTYIIEGMAGLPVWSPGATMGVARLAGPTGGYIAGFLIAAFVVGALAEHGWDRRIRTATFAMLIGELTIYAIGLPWLARFIGPETVLDAGLIPFIPGDIYKVVLAAVALPLAWLVTRKVRGSPRESSR